MKKTQYLGQLRAALTAAGTALAVWGISDGQQWAPVVGVILALISLSWGIVHHIDPKNPGRLSWSLARKTANVIGSALVTYGILNPGQVDAVLAVLVAAGPLLAGASSWIDNSPPPPPDPRPHRRIPPKLP